jgi:hypothetical protein
MSPLLQFALEHPDLAFLATIFWHLWVAFALTLIGFEIRAHNNRAEQADMREQFRQQRGRT